MVISIKFFRLVYLLCYHYISLTFLTILLLGVLYEKRRDRWWWRRRH